MYACVVRSFKGERDEGAEKCEGDNKTGNGVCVCVHKNSHEKKIQNNSNNEKTTTKMNVFVAHFSFICIGC